MKLVLPKRHSVSHSIHLDKSTCLYMAKTMATTVSFVSTICFVLLQLILTNIPRVGSLTSYENATDPVLSLRSGRGKRTPSLLIPDELKMIVRYSTGETDEFNFIKGVQHLANEHLPVVTPSKYAHLNVMENVGDFVTYRDEDNCAAIVYFKKHNTIFGVIGLNYAITNLPYETVMNGYYPTVVEGSYITRRLGALGHDDSPLPETDMGSVSGIKRPSDCDAGPSNKHQRTDGGVVGKINKNANSNLPKIRERRWDPRRKEYFLEILLFVTSDVAEFFENLYGADIHLEWIVRYYILYFNAVDMTFEKVRNRELGLHINIAKIVIEDKAKPFNFVNDGEINFSETVRKLRDYLETEQHIYTPDSFDHVFISTRRTIMDNSISVFGVTSHDADMYIARQNDQSYNAVSITAVGFDSDYIIAVHEIGRLLKLEIDSRSVGQCNSIMQEGSSMCDKCLSWSADSERQFDAFFGTNRNRCFWLNKPRSLRPPGPSRFIPPTQQCHCFGYHSHVRIRSGKPRYWVGVKECNVSLQCEKRVGSQISYEYTLTPFDGTPCAFSEVCWEGQCVKLKPSRCSKK